MQSIFTDSPTYAYVALVAAEVVLLAIWHERRTRKLALALGVPILLAGAVFVVEAMVVTDREIIEDATRQIAHDLVEGSTASVELYLDDEFGGTWASKKLAIGAAKVAIMVYKVCSIRFGRLEVEVDGDEAKMDVVTRMTIEAEAMEAPVVIGWDVRWIRRDVGWRIVQVRKRDELN